MERRDFLSILCKTTALTTLSSNVFAIPSIQTNEQKFLFVFLRGAYDGLNLLIPHNDELYYESRPNIGIKQGDNQEQSLFKLTNDFSLNPSVRETLGQLFLTKELSFIHASGSPDNSRSHFNAQDLIEFGDFRNKGRRENGFLYRLFRELSKKEVFPISYTNNLPLILKGEISVPNISLKGNLKFNINDRQTDLYQKLYAKDKLEHISKEGLKIHKDVSAEYEKEMMKASKDANSPKGFSEETYRMAKLIKEQKGIVVGFVDVGGWDTHTNQGSYNGTLANNLKQLSEGLVTFRNQLGGEWNNTTVVVMSEFGRTIKENGNRGTDHGHGNVMWVLGGNVNGGKVAGEWTRLSKELIHENRDLPVLNDYRSILADLFFSRFGLSTEKNKIIFPNYSDIKFKL